ncbi:PIN domain-containing protein [Bowmanella dokdonensis]|uniref:Type II toxin-antitoxin system VapC family toxin n=1 Tax=Bowmanella dokdonensis TaxID=751969 RepID=A0A939DPW5_9ALTE|nr:type II toxin-antitoxin system VapC family toxin [Bowmanella dokdonensis]MBN7825761.1 type II toxin-antitoxin system VapC family toxin [Bowmanella dokdonensis]
MIAVDTNIVLRYLLQDDEKQSSRASKIFEGSEKVLITDVVLVETIWTLRGKRYRLDKAKLVAVLHGLIEEPNVVFEDGHCVWCALVDYTNARTADFADALIVNKSQRYVSKGKQTVSLVYTFDKGALEIDGTKKP